MFRFSAAILIALSLSPATAMAASGTVAEAALHWSYSKPVAPSLPEVQNVDWPRNSVDYFVLSRLEQNSLKPSDRATRASLVRRLHLDLIGLPPTPATVRRFVESPNPNAYEELVDELLASPYYGERWARPWLDLARYADSNGFQRDGFRDLWAYRDWVIEAFNDDMPFDQFTIEQIAGDLMPDASQSQKIATGFNRCPTVNVEAGTDQEANRVNQVVDRVNTTATVWLGSTIQCAQCHDHKYDPVSQKEYFQLYAYFNNTEIETKFRTAKATAAIDFVSPMIDIPMTAAQTKRLESLEAEASEQQSTISKLKQNKKEKELIAAQAKLKKLRNEINRVGKPKSLVMKELNTPRTTAVMVRGSFLHLGEKVTPTTPGFLHAKPDGPPNRLTFAKWLVDKENPLVARVTVNRWWAEFFGQGLVPTPEDFGLQGTPPTHPKLLDHLATQFMASGWSMKRVHKLIVTSATYQQSSRIRPELLEADPANKLYSRGARFRMSAEMIRDNALSAAGLLSLDQGGPPVKPWQPANIWRVIGQVDNTYKVSEGTDRYRRGIYTIWRRSAPYPSFVAFDAPTRSACVVQRSRSNTPMQALTLLNDPVYVEAAQALAQRIIREQPDRSPSNRIRHGYTLCLSRLPSSNEEAVLLELYHSELSRLRNDSQTAKTRTKGLQIPSGSTREEVAAWSFVASVLLNLDEMITRG